MSGNILGDGDVRGQCCRGKRIVVDTRDDDVARQRVAVGVAVIDGEADRTSRGVRVFTAVGISDAPDRGFVLSQRRRSGQGPSPRATVVDARDAVLVDERQRVFAAVVVSCNLDDRGFDVRVVDIAE